MEEENVQGLEGRDTESLQLTLRQGVKERNAQVFYEAQPSPL